jgi:hypothetical protein
MITQTAPTLVDRLFPSLAAGEFARDHYPTRGCVAHAPLDRLGDLGTWPVWDDLGALVEQLGGDAVIGYSRSADGRPRQAAYPRARWRSLYDAGATVELTASDIPRFRALCDDVATGLGMSRSLVTADVFLSPGGEAVPKHFDSVDVIVVQVRGSKRWQLAPNDELRFPANAFIPGFGADIRNHRPMAKDGPQEFSREMPESAETVVLNPGSVLFVPRGVWHQTSAVTDSISISIVTRPPTTGDLLRSLVDRSILSQPAFREPLSLAREGGLDAVRERLSALLEQLKAEPLPISKDGVETRRFRRRPGIDLAVEGAGDDSWVVTVTRGGDRPSRMAVPSYVAKLFSWVGAARGPFGATEPLPLFPPGSGDWIESSFATMARMGILEAVPGTT